MIKRSEVGCYKYILDEIGKKGWDKSNVYSQQECLGIEEIKKFLVLDRPENVIQISEEIFYIIEGKNEKAKIKLAVDEAQNQYAKKINQSKKIKALFVSGVAGNDSEGYLSQSYYFNGTKWDLIKENGIEITSILSPTQIEIILKNKSALIEDVEISESEFLKTAIEINKILHENSINKDYRARFMSALLLSMTTGEDLNLNENALVLINNINKKVELILRNHKKQDFSKFIRIDEPSNEDNHVKVKDAIKRTYQKLLDLNIRSAMNSGRDVLGEFYEVFLKYGNGAKEIGIVLTPRHITRFAAYTLDIDANDLVLDLACGTGGFLVSAYDEVKRKTKNQREFENFKQNGIYGIEEQDPIISLAIVNMIFRGDGKTNMIEGNCFNKWLTVGRTETGRIKAEYLDKNEEGRMRPITKVMINPPFSQEKKEFEFIEQALNQMQDGGILFCVLPVGVMVKQAAFFSWRNEMLKKNTLLSVVAFPTDLFYPVGTHTLGLYLKKGVPHNNQNVLWIKADTDGFVKVKGRRVFSKKESNQLSEVAEIVKDFIKDPTLKIKNVQEFIKIEGIDFQDKNLELLPQVYLDEKKPSEEVLYKRIDLEMRNFISSMIKYNKREEFEENVIKKDKDFFVNTSYKKDVSWKEFYLTDLFETPIKTGNYHKSSELDDGNIPLVSCVSVDCGFEGFYNIENKNHIMQNAITIASDGQPLTSFYHYYKFTTKDNVLICKPLKPYKFTTLLFFVTQINSLKWRFSYGRKCYENKVDQLKIFLPINSKNEIDEEYLNSVFKKTDIWDSLRSFFHK